MPAGKPQENRADRPLGMRRSELEILGELARTHAARRILEIGMADASSTLALLEATRDLDGATVVSIDPFQFADPPGASGYGIQGRGVANVGAAGFAGRHTCIAEPDYLALPDLVRRGAVFDLVVIDGYHSFESTLLDFIYADKLLRVGGLVAFHDSALPAVYKAVRYVMTNTAYEVVGPRPEPVLDALLPKVLRRARYLLNGQNAAFTERRLKWCSLAVFRKLRDEAPPELRLVEF
jgi:predicted O-methyltransferase YrrM